MAGPITEEVFKSCCKLCYRMCGVLVHVRDGKVAKVEGDPECPANLGSLCIKGLAAVEILYHPDRLKYPLKRAGARGEGKWQRVSWDEALETIAQAMNRAKEKQGAESSNEQCSLKGSTRGSWHPATAGGFPSKAWRVCMGGRNLTLMSLPIATHLTIHRLPPPI